MNPREEMDRDTLNIPFEIVYPYGPYYYRNSTNLCVADDHVASDQIAIEGKYRYLKNCAKKYYYAMSIDLYDEGGSWLKPR